MHDTNTCCQFLKAATRLWQRLWKASVSRNTIRDYLGMSELKLLDERKYEETVARVQREKTKHSVKDFKKACRSQVLEYYDEVNLWQ